MKGTSSCCQAGPLHPLGRRPCLVDRHVQPPRGGTYQCSRVTGHQQRRRAPRGQRAGRRGAVGAGSNRRAHVSGASSTQGAGPRHRRGGALRVPVHRRTPGHGTRASRKHSQPSSSTAAPASHGRRWPTSSAPPGTAPVPAASGRARAPTRCTRRANATTKRQRRSGGGAHRPTPPCATDAASQGRVRVEGRRTAVRRFGTRSGAAPRSRSQQPAPALSNCRKRAIGRRPPCRRTTHGTSSQRAAPSPSSATLPARRRRAGAR